MPECSQFLAQNESSKVALIIGGGVNGVCNAFELHKKGYKTAILETRDEVASECSFATWGGLSTHYLIVDKSALFRQHSDAVAYNNFDSVRMNWSRILLDPHFLRWGLCWLLHRSRVDTEQRTIDAMRRFVKDAVLYQIDSIRNNALIADLSEQCQLNEHGFVHVYRRNDDKNCRALTSMMAQHGDGVGVCPVPDDVQRAVVFDCRKQSLRDIEKQIGDEQHLLSNLPDPESIRFVKHTSEGFMVDSPKFCRALKEYLVEDGSLAFFGDTKVLDFEVDSDTKRVRKIYTNRGVVRVGENVCVVLSCGSWTPVLARKLSLFVPVYPLKGYDLVIDFKDDVFLSQLPKHGLIDNAVFYALYGAAQDRQLKRIRIASYGVFNGWDTQSRAELEDALFAQGMRMLPKVRELFERSDMCCVTGLRPLTHDTSVVVGKVRQFENVFLNVGPGYNGFKTAMGSARLLSQAMAGELEDTGFEPHEHGVVKSTLFCKMTDALGFGGIHARRSTYTP